MKKHSIIVCCIFFAVLVSSYTLFLSKSDNNLQLQSYAQTVSISPSPSPQISPVPSITYGVIAPCPTCTSPSPSLSPSPEVTVTPSPSVDPCAPSQIATTAADNQDRRRHHRHRHHKHSGGFNDILQQLLELIRQLLEQLGIDMPDIPGTPSPEPSVAPSTEPSQTTQPSSSPAPSTGNPTVTTNPCPTNTTVPSVSAQPSSGVSPTISAGPSVSLSPNPSGAGQTAQVEITFYGSYDNDPQGSLGISDPVIHQEAGGVGTFEDPLTFASPDGTGAYAVGTKIYVPMVQKYFIKEDTCATSWTAPNGCGAVSHVDLYVGNPSSDVAVVDCENAITPSGNGTIIINPPANLTYDPTPIWNQSTGACMTPHQ